MKRVGLTGGIATGKSHVRAVFEALGVPTIDADVLAHEAVAPGSAGFDAVKARFGPEVVDARGAIDRRKLGTIRRADGRIQVTYAGRPLYYYVGDRRPGQILCQDVEEFGGLWLVVRPSGAPVR